jgi:hypothetical protein
VFGQVGVLVPDVEADLAALVDVAVTALRSMGVANVQVRWPLTVDR